jgi:hypothetical protein
VIGRDACLEEATTVVRSILWDRVLVGRGGKVTRCLIGQDTALPCYGDWEDEVVVSPRRGTPRAGSPRRGLGEILADEKIQLDRVDSVTVNTLPSQGCATVRVEEAMFTTLSILNLVLHLGTQYQNRS